MNSQISARTTSIQSALLVKTNGLPSRFPISGLIWNWCIGSILARAATLVFPLSPVRTLLRNLPNFTHGGAEPEEQHRQHHPPGPDQAIDRPADQRAAERVADQDGEDSHPRILRLARNVPLAAGPRRFFRLRLAEPLVERGQPRIRGRLRVLPGIVFRHAVLPVRPRPARSGASRRGTCRRTNPPRRGSFRKRPEPSQHNDAVQHSPRTSLQRKLESRFFW